MDDEKAARMSLKTKLSKAESESKSKKHTDSLPTTNSAALVMRFEELNCENEAANLM